MGQEGVPFFYGFNGKKADCANHVDLEGMTQFCHSFLTVMSQPPTVARPRKPLMRAPHLIWTESPWQAQRSCFCFWTVR